MKKKSLLLVIAIFIAIVSFSQNKPWKEQGNNATSFSKLGTTNNESLKIITNDQERMKVNANGGVEINDYLKVNGYTETDSLYVRGSLIISKDSSSFFFDPNVGLPACDRMRVSTGNFAIMHGVNLPPPWGFQLATPFVRVGLGTQNAQSKLHLFHPTGNVFSQTTNNNTGVTATDGFLVGIADDGTAELRQQENRAIRIFTNEGLLNEQRMIISHDATINVPRVGIGMNNLLEPRTFLHIGQDINETGTGYRNWMNVGELVVGEKSINMYFGLSDNNIRDHIINWGSEFSLQNENIVRFVNTSGNDLVQSGSPDGLEIARMVSDGTTGRMGIGDFFTIPDNPTQVLDVIGNARLRELPDVVWQDESLTRCVVVDDDGVLYWRNFNGSSTGGSLGNICASPTSNPLLNDWEIPLNDHNFVFSGQGPIGTNSVGIGIPDCQPTAKLDVLINTGELQSVGIRGTSSLSTAQIGIEGNALDGAKQIGVKGYALDCLEGSHSCGVQGDAISNTILEATYNFGGHFFAENGNVNIGVFGRGASTGLAEGNFGSYFSADNAEFNFGVYSACVPNPDASGLEHNWAGYFDGNVNIDGDLWFNANLLIPSDLQFKQNVQDYDNAIEMIRSLRPVTYNYDTLGFDINFPSEIQYGLIAQEVEEFFPNIVHDQVLPPRFDTVGNIVSDSIHCKGINYLQLTPILVQAVKELDGNIIDITEIPEAPILISPENNDTLQFMPKEIPNVFFVWHSCENTLCYMLDFSYSEDMSDVIETQITFDTVVQIVFPLNQDTVIYWSVKSVGAFGLSNYSEIRHFHLKSTFEDFYQKSVSELSDINLKTNINNIEDALTKIMSLQGVNFEWDLANNPGRNLTEGTNLGLIAQEVQQIFPDVVNMGINGYLYIDYTSLIPVLIESVKELKYINDSLSQRLNDMEIRLDNIEQFLIDDLGDVQMKNANDPSFSQEVTLENTKAIVLNQNVPNPFKEQTTISFQIPDNIASAKIVFIDNLGNILKQVEINDRGYGELIVYAHDLSAGHYTYYLVADGNTIKSKRMVLTR